MAKPLHGPPAPNELVYAARVAAADALDPVEVVAAACALHDLARATLPTGGGLVSRRASLALAHVIVSVLDRRGMLTRQGTLL